MNIYTIGFTKKSAEHFFDLLKSNGVTCLVDIRLRPDGQLAGFTKKEDLRYFLRELIQCDYRHMPQLAPTAEILDTYRKDHDWQRYETTFAALMDERGIPEVLDKVLFEEEVCCLLCSEVTPEQCHRRLVAEHLAQEWENVTIVHL